MQGKSRLRRPASRLVVGALALVVAAGGGLALGQAGQPEKVVACQSNRTLLLADPATGQCPANQARVELTTTAYQGFAPAAELEFLRGRVRALETLLAGVRRSDDGRTLVFDRMNVQVVNGEGSTETANGLGNLVVGYDEGGSLRNRNGSHNVVIGPGHGYERFGGLVAGRNNRLAGPFAAVLGAENQATGHAATVTGGRFNIASGESSSVSGGERNTAAGHWSSILGGRDRTLDAGWATHPPDPAVPPDPQAG